MAALSGLRMYLESVPRALPWAEQLQPFGLETCNRLQTAHLPIARRFIAPLFRTRGRIGGMKPKLSPTDRFLTIWLIAIACGAFASMPHELVFVPSMTAIVAEIFVYNQ